MHIGGLNTQGAGSFGNQGLQVRVDQNTHHVTATHCNTHQRTAIHCNTQFQFRAHTTSCRISPPVPCSKSLLLSQALSPPTPPRHTHTTSGSHTLLLSLVRPRSFALSLTRTSLVLCLSLSIFCICSLFLFRTIPHSFTTHPLSLSHAPAYWRYVLQSI